MITPFIKWVGGKTQILEILFDIFPKVSEIDCYYEPFLGGGSVLFEFLNRLDDENSKIHNSLSFQHYPAIFVNDINRDLIDVYETIKTHPSKLIEQLEIIKTNYFKNPNVLISDKKRNIIVPLPTIEENIEKGCNYVYYFYRELYNSLKKLNGNRNFISEGISEKDIILKSAIFIFLNKTGFRGVYRETLAGAYNVPFGNYKNPDILTIISKMNILEISEKLDRYNVNFSSLGFNDFLKEVKNRFVRKSTSFVYLDPPYYPENANSFVSYSADGFSQSEHQSLVDNCKALSSQKVKFVLSNSDTDFIKNSFSGEKVEIKTIECKRSINSKNPESKVNEILISN